MKEYHTDIGRIYQWVPLYSSNNFKGDRKMTKLIKGVQYVCMHPQEKVVYEYDGSGMFDPAMRDESDRTYAEGYSVLYAWKPVELPQEPETFVPVVGEECELTPHNAMWGFSNGKPVICTVVGLYLDWIVVAEEHCAPITTRLDKCDLAPVKTECEKVCEFAVAGISGVVNEETLNMIVGQLYDAGMLVMPESK